MHRLTDLRRGWRQRLHHRLDGILDFLTLGMKQFASISQFERGDTGPEYKFVDILDELVM